MMTPDVVKRSSEIIDQLLELITQRIAKAPSDELKAEMIAIVISLEAWTSAIEGSLSKPAQAYARQVGAQLAKTIEAPKT